MIESPFEMFVETKKMYDYGYFCPSQYPIMVDPKGKHCWINVPKCGSSFIQKVLDDYGWIVYRDPEILKAFKQSPTVKKFCVLRDPLKRWISGFAQCYDTMDKLPELLDNPTFWKVILKNPHFDDHTEAMYKFLKHTNDYTYIYMGDEIANGNRFYRDLSGYLTSIGYDSQYFKHWDSRINPYTNAPAKKAINLKLRQILKDNVQLNNSLNSALKFDYELIDENKRYKSDSTSD